MSRSTLEIADLFCGAGGTSTGIIQAATSLGFQPRLTAVNHWPRAVETHSANHPGARHVCAAVDSINPRHLYPGGQLDLLWASPECTHHSRARGGKPVSDQSRASAHCVTRWAEALKPSTVLVENVPEFAEWGPLGVDGKPLKSRRGATFRAWIGMLQSLGYTVEHRILCAADFGDPTTRSRLFVQAVLGRRRPVWPKPTHSRTGDPDLFGEKKRWRAAREIIDWSLPSRSIFERSRPLAPNTLRRIYAGLELFGLRPFVTALDHQSSNGVWSPDAPLTTVTTKARHCLAEPFIVPQQSGGQLRPVSEPVPTISTAGAISLVEPFIVEYYGTASARSVDDPLATATTKARFGLAQPEIEIDGALYRIDINFRMLQPHELSAAQGFPKGYRFAGTKSEVIKQIGNAVPCGLSRALGEAVLTQ